MKQGTATWIFMVVMGGLALAGCVSVPPAPGAGAQAPASGPAPRAWRAEEAPTVLRMGIHYYEQGEYPRAEEYLLTALDLGLPTTEDQIRAYKYLAFIACATEREDACRAAFKTALQLEPKFALSRSEAGHPMWGPVFKSVRAELGLR
jgi:Tfp pilus assembly protein PilF